MLSWIPLLGPIIQGLMNTGASIYTKYKDTELGKLQTNRTNDTEEARIAAATVRDNQDNLGIRILTDMALTPPVVWSMLIGWDTIVAKRFPDLMFKVADYPPNVQYIPYMAFVFLFGAVGLNIWKRR